MYQLFFALQVKKNIFYIKNYHKITYLKYHFVKKKSIVMLIYLMDIKLNGMFKIRW